MIRVLLADRHELLRKGLRALLEQEPAHEVCGEAQHGPEAVAQARRDLPNVVVVGTLSPGPTGLETAQRIVREAPGSEVLLLGYEPSSELARRAMHAGVLGHLLFSDSPADFLAAVRALADHTPFQSPNVPVQGTAAPSPLTAREREVLQAVAEGRQTGEIALLLGISKKTVETHRSAIMRKLRLRRLAEVVRYAVRHQLVPP